MNIDTVSRIEVSADKTKCMFMSRDKNGGGSHNTKIDNSSFERVEEFKYLGTTLTNQILFRKEIRADWSQGSVCYHSMQILLSFSLLSKTLNINNCNFDYCYVWVWNLVVHIEGET